MAGAMELFQAGKLNDAVAAAIEQVKNKPSDIAARWTLCSLCCYTGDLERVDKHLDLIGEQEPKNAAGISLFRQLIRAEQARRQFFTEGRIPEFLGQPSDEMQLRLAASIRIREGAHAQAAELLAQAQDKRRPVQGTHSGQRFADLRDLDDLTASLFEVYTSTGKYYWVPMERVSLLEFRAPSGLRDVLWRRARMAVRGGPDGEVFLPALYSNSHAHENELTRMGRATDWIEGESRPVRGVGLRMFLLRDDAVTISDLKTFEFDAPDDIGSASVAPLAK